MQAYQILWADDEIEFLKPHILFLEQKGYQITAVNNGAEAVELCQEQAFDLVFLDENMPGLTGLEALVQIKSFRPQLPVVMITKSEEEHIMEDAIGLKIADYLIKPVNPNQLLLSLKKHLENKRLVSEKTTVNYQQEFRNLAMDINDRLDHQGWAEVYQRLVFWELELEQSQNKEMSEVLETQKAEANSNFSKFIKSQYPDWMSNPKAEKPLLSHQILKNWMIPELKSGRPLVFLLMDNMRLDQWKVLSPLFADLFAIEQEQTYYAMLPTTTSYARNAIFAGLSPAEIARQFPSLWVGELDEDGKNLHEESLLQKFLQRNQLAQLKMQYIKITSQQQGRQLADTVQNVVNYDLSVIVYNFIDMLSHARTDMAMIRELAPDEAAYRSITRSWFEHSPLFEALQKLADKDICLILTTDHGTVRVKRPKKILGDRQVNTNLRYKQGKNLSYEEGDVWTVSKPEQLQLPRPHLSTSFVFALEDYFFAYPNNYHHYVNMYRDTFQHGGVSLEEMIVPFVTMKSKNA